MKIQVLICAALLSLSFATNARASDHSDDSTTPDYPESQFVCWALTTENLEIQGVGNTVEEAKVSALENCRSVSPYKACRIRYCR